MKKINRKYIWPAVAFVCYLLLNGLTIWWLKKTYIFANSDWFYLSGLIALSIIWYFYKTYSKEGELTLSNFDSLESTESSVLTYLRHLPFVLSIVGFTALVYAMARPQLNEEHWQTKTTEGIEIVLALDLSGSMLAKDFKPNRLEASKEVAIDFIDQRPNDKIGLVIYEGEAFLQCPTTTDHKTLKRLFVEAKSGKVKGGTAIGAGLATAVNAIANSETKSKTIILLTDGVNQAPNQISPLTAADIANAMNVRVYTIGVGTTGMAPMPVSYDRAGNYVYKNMPVEIDEELLQEISKKTNGKYFRATDKKGLEDIYKEIDKLEKSRQRVTDYTNIPEKYYSFLVFGLICIGLQYLLNFTWFKSITA